MNRFTACFLSVFLMCGAGMYLLIGIEGCSSTPSVSTIAYETIGASETAVLAANGAFLDSVVLGLTPTNNVPTVEAAFNETQLALHTAAALASGGTNAPIPAMTNAKVVSFTNLVNSVKGK